MIAKGKDKVKFWKSVNQNGSNCFMIIVLIDFHSFEVEFYKLIFFAGKTQI